MSEKVKVNQRFNTIAAFEIVYLLIDTLVYICLLILIIFYKFAPDEILAVCSKYNQ